MFTAKKNSHNVHCGLRAVFALGRQNRRGESLLAKKKSGGKGLINRRCFFARAEVKAFGTAGASEIQCGSHI